MRRSDAFPSQFVSKDDAAVPRRVTISSIIMQEIKGENGMENKPVMHFSDFDKPLILNNINWMSCEDRWGDDSDAWTGNQVELYVDPNVMFGNKRVGGVRVRIPAGTAAAHTPSRNGDYWTITQALEQVTAARANVDDFKKLVKDHNISKWNPVEHTKLARDFIAASASPFGTETVFKEEEIPFDLAPSM